SWRAARPSSSPQPTSAARPTWPAPAAHRYDTGSNWWTRRWERPSREHLGGHTSAVPPGRSHLGVQIDFQPDRIAPIDDLGIVKNVAVPGGEHPGDIGHGSVHRNVQQAGYFGIGRSDAKRLRGSGYVHRLVLEHDRYDGLCA